MDADEIESVQELAAGGVGGVMAVSEAALIGDETGGAVSGDIVIASFQGGGAVDIGEESLDGGIDVIGAAECTHRAVLFQRVGLFRDAALHDLGLARAHGPLGRIMPVPIAGEDLIRIQQGPVLGLEEELAVRRSGGPVHEAGGLVAGIVHHLDADVTGHHAGNRGVFLGGDFPGERDDQADAGRFGGVLVGGIHQAAEVEEHTQLLPDAGDGVVQVQREEAAAEDKAVFARPLFQGAADEAADILDLVLPRLGKLAVFGDGLGCADGLGAAG